MHPSLLDPLAARRPPAIWLGAAGAIALGCAAGIAAAGAVVDAALAAGAVGALALGGLLAWRSARARALPLEIGPVALGGEVDALPVVRLRARLGLGRACRDVRARVWVLEGVGGRELAAQALPGAVIGPFTVVAADPERRLRPGDRVRIEVTVRAAGRTWSAAREVDAPARAGRFAGPGWLDEDPADAGGAC